jgi:outer membrane protein OmpA-like peptidoglycan-associated protein
MGWLLHLTALALLALTAPAKAQTVDLLASGPQPYVIDELGRRMPLYDASYALLVSQRHYMGTARKGWRPLDATEREMDEVATVLRQHGFNVRRASDLSSVQLTNTFRRFIAEYGRAPNNRLLFFFSGHGYTDNSTDMSYIMPVDALDPNLFPQDYISTALPIDTVQTWAKELKARHALFLFDSCFSGSIFLSRSSSSAPDSRGMSPSERLAYFRGSSAKPVRQFIAAGGPTEELPANSKFVPLFIEAINGRAARLSDGYITGKELGMWLEQMVPKYQATQNPHSGVIREPRFSFGDMVFQPPLRGVSVAASPSPPVVAPGSDGTPVFAPDRSTTPSVTAAAPATIPSPPPAPVREKVTFAVDTYFVPRGATLTPTATLRLDDLRRKTSSVSLEMVIAVGHADSQETNALAAQKLSIARAEQVKAYLVDSGVEPNRIYTEGKGSAQPVADNRTEEGRAKNRRVEIEVVGTRVKGQ